MPEKTIIEVNGVKLEVDLRHARRVDEIRVGDRVKLLVKQYDGHKVVAGIVVGFEPFQKLPTIVVAYVDEDWSSASLKFLSYNAKTTDTELVVAVDEDFQVDRNAIVARFDRQIAAKQREIDAIEEQKRYFLGHFRAYWERVADAPAEPGAEF